MKIAFIGGRTFNQPDGIANFMYHLACHLVELGDEPIVYCESDKNAVEHVNGFKVVHLKSYKSAAVTKILLGWKATTHALHKEKGVEVFHYNGWAPSLLSCRLPYLYGRISLMQGHGLEWKRTKYSPRQQKFMRFMEKLTAHTNKNLVMCSQEQTDFFKKEYGKVCKTITGGVEMPGEASPSTILDQHNIHSGKYVLYMGRLVQDKNPDFLIKGFLKSNYKKYGLQLVLAGSNDGDPAYVSYLKSLGNEDVIFTGAVVGNDKDTLFRYCYAYCLPSTLEGLPISLLEAMSYGKICIVSDIPANHEALGDSGLWVRYENENDITEQINNLCDNYSKFEHQGDINMKRAKDKFSWNTIAHEYHAHIEKLLLEKKRL